MGRTKPIQKAKIHDFRVVDQVLYESDPDAGNIVYIGSSGNTAYPFVVARRVSGPSGWYVDTCKIKAAGKFEIAEWDRTFELEGESVDQWVADLKRNLVLPGAGTFTVEYSVYGDPLVEIAFDVVAADPPYVGIVPGSVDAALDKGAIAWLTTVDEKQRKHTKPIWYGYQRGIVYVLTGPGEQAIPGLAEGTTVKLAVRSKEKQSLVGEMDCSVRLLPKGLEWVAIARDILLGRRLNLTDGDQAVDRWGKNAEIYVLTPIPPEVPAEG